MAADEKVITRTKSVKGLLSDALEFYSRQQWDDAQKLYSDAKTLAEEKGDTDSLSKAYLGISKIALMRGHFDEVVENANNAIHYASFTGSKSEEATALNLLGISLFNLGDLTNALTNYFKGLNIAKEINNKKLQSQFLNNLSNCYHWMHEVDNAIEYSHMAMDIAIEVGNKSDLCSIKSNLGLLLANSDKSDEALKYLNESLEMNLTEVKNPDSLAKTYNNFAAVYIKQGNYDEVLKNYFKSLEIVTQNEDESTIANTNMLIGNTYFDMKDYQKSAEYLEEALRVALKINSKRLENAINKSLADTYEALGEYQKAYYCFETYFKLESQATKEFSDLKVKYLNIAHRVDIAKKEAEILQEKNNELDQLNKKLIALNEEKNEFLGIAVHDLKNPLNGISLAASGLIKNFDKIPQEKFDSIINRIESVTNRMKLILSNLLDVNAIESGEYNLNFQNINIPNLLKETVSHFRHVAEEKDISLEYENKLGELLFSTDETALTEVLENLISNAIKYSETKKSVWVVLSKGEKNFQIQIIDSGLGIKEEEQDKIFKKFAKISNKPTAGEGSTGLGLSIVKKLTELLGGNITFKSIYGSGSTFTLEF